MNKYEECSYCRRVNSPLCEQCRDASLLLINDTRRFFYINREGEARRGPVEAFLLPYMNVWGCSYVLEIGKEKWDFAGEVLDKRTLKPNFNYCPICNNKVFTMIGDEWAKNTGRLYKDEENGPTPSL